jgi:uncharacterized membrane protein YedE/YeeE
MTLSGSCPGTVFVQVGTGVSAGLYTLAGAVLGGIIWSNVLRPIFASLKSKTRPSLAKTENLTIYGALGTTQEVAAVGVGAVFAVIVAAISALDLAKTEGLVGPVVGGLLVAGVQTLSVVTRKALLGTSASFEEVGDYFSWFIRGRGNTSGGNKPGSSSITVVTGMIVGALGLSLAYPLPQVLPPVHLEAASLVLGGVLLAIGARMGGGCTSGHGISGISLLSVSSFVSVAAMFAGAMGTAAVLSDEL